ncbi:protein lin-54 homolog [Musca domestica]|uniref:Protein lin-54 homolog n=1 Tax=Musca domestica TaxID=7370 RepID=A0A1I8MZJ9_MUSDO|nr:protein lin-54 homolog [Musca domestica]
MDSLEDSSSVPEFSFDDLLEPSPAKKNGKSPDIDEDSLEYEIEEKDDSLNTPEPKQKYRMVPKTITNSFISNKAVPMRTNLAKPAGQMATYVKNPGNGGGAGVGNTSSSSAAPILLNTKNILPKMAAQITNNSIKITPKTVSSSAAGSGGVVTASTSGTSSVLSIGGKTAVRTASGHLLYIQKTTASSTATTTGTATKVAGNTTTMLKTQQNAAGGGGGGNKPVTIQVMRNADGNFVPLKTSTGPNGKNTTLTLSPTATLAGKKIIASTAGGQVLIKSLNSSGVTSSSNPGVKTMVVKQTTGANTTLAGELSKPKTITVQTSAGGEAMGKPKTITVQTSPGGDGIGKPKTFLVQSNSGKQILVTNPNLVKLSQKPSTSGAGMSSQATTTTTSVTNNSTAGSIQTVQISSKQGLQYLRVVPQTKTSTAGGTGQEKVVTTTSVAKPLSTSTTTTTATASKPLTPSAPVKILNNLPQKFTVVQKGGGTKVVVTQKKDANGVEFTPIASKVQKTIVAMPPVKAVTEGTAHSKQQESTRTPQTMAGAGQNPIGNQAILRKHKISEINTELKRITASDADDNGPPEVKKPTSNNRMVVIASNAPTILNSGSQQQQQISGRLSNSAGVNSLQVQGTRTAAANNNSNTNPTGATPRTRIAAGDKMYTLVKSSGQQNPPKLYSVLKGNQVLNTTTTTSQTTFTAPAATQKTLINQQAVLRQQQQQQQKVFHLKQMQKSKTSNQLAAPMTTASHYSSIEIKEEPLEFFESSSSTTTTVVETKQHQKPLASTLSSASLLTSSSALNNPSSSTSASSLQNLPSISAELKEDPNKLDLVGAVRRKHCNCSKSQCLKLYCDCFANGEFCQDCTCKDCCNNLENEDERQRAIRSCLERNPSAFKPKITSSSDLGDMRLHNKGCNCKRSGCLKNYCECYEAKIPCSSNCKCVGCRNVEDRPDLDMDPVDPKVMATIANASASTSHKRPYDKSSQRDSHGNIKSEKYGKEAVKQEYGAELNSDLAPPEKQQCNFITQEVVDATIQCMVTQADECEKNGLPAYQMEKMVMEELGRCLVEIIDFSIRNTDTSYTQD